MRRYNRELRALLPSLPDSLSCLHSALFSQLVLGQHDPMPVFRTAAYSDVLAFELRVQQALNTRIAIVQVAVQNNPVCHNHHSCHLE